MNVEKRLFASVAVLRRFDPTGTRSKQTALLTKDQIERGICGVKQTPGGLVGQIKIGNHYFGCPLNPDDQNDPFYMTDEYYYSIPDECWTEARDCT